MAPLGCSAAPTQEDTASDEADTTEADLTELDTESAPEDGGPSGDAAGAAAPCPEADAARLEDELRAAVGLEAWQELRPAPQAFRRLAEAIAFRARLISDGRYKPSQLGVFAQDVSSKGAKQWLVATCPGFALAGAPKRWELGRASAAGRPPEHLYEVILEDSPCWLYFDLEFSRSANPDVQPQDLTAAFLGTLGDFCSEALGSPLDLRSVYELDSTTPEKFSQHVIAKRLLQGPGSARQNLAFKNNAQAGLLVGKFLDFARERRQRAGPSADRARLLFLRPASPQPAPAPAGTAPVSLAPPAAAAPAAQACPAAAQEASVVDTAVYSRNRCFRVLFSSKLGKQRILVPRWGAPGEPPARQLLQSLASFVPEGTPLLEHDLIPRDFAHGMLDVRRRGRRESGSCGGGPQVARTSTSCASSCPPMRQSLDDPLLEHLARTWDRVRRQLEPFPPTASVTGVQSTMEVDARFLAVTLARNRFCFCKGSSHKSNAVYLVVDKARGVFYQKCHDVDCRHFRSVEFPVPQQLVPRDGQSGWGAGPPGARQPAAPAAPEAWQASLAAAAPATPPAGRRRSSRGEDLHSPPRAVGKRQAPTLPAAGVPSALAVGLLPPGAAAAGVPPAKRWCCSVEAAAASSGSEQLPPRPWTAAAM